jgi:hypothetical protein
VKTRATPSIVGSPQSNGSSNRLVHFVRQGGAQLTHRGHSADVCEIRLRSRSASSACFCSDSLTAASPVRKKAPDDAGAQFAGE